MNMEERISTLMLHILKVVKDNGDVTLNIESKGNVDIKARKMQILVSNDETEEEEFEDAAGVSDIA